MRMRTLCLAAAAAMAAHGTAKAAIVEQVTYVSADSIAVLNTAGNAVGNYVSTAPAPYLVQRVGLAGVLQTKLTNTRPSHASLAMTAGPTNPALSGFVPITNTSTSLSTYQNYLGTAFNVSSQWTTAVNPGETFSTQFYETTDNGAGADATWLGITEYFADSTAPAVVEDLGTFGPADTVNISRTVTLGAEQVKWFKFTLSSALGSSSYLTFDTTGANTLADPDSTPDADTQLGLYNGSTGAVINGNDDVSFSGGNLLSSLRVGSGAAGGLYTPTTSLAAGTYYIGIDGYSDLNMMAGAGSYMMGSTSDITGDVTFNFTAGVVPEPATLGLLALAPLAAIRRKRK